MLSPENAVPLLEAACSRQEPGDERLFDACRQFVLDNGSEVVEAGGLDQLQELAVAKGLLRDSINKVKRLQDKYCKGDGNPRARKRRRGQ